MEENVLWSPFPSLWTSVLLRLFETTHTREQTHVFLSLSLSEEAKRDLIKSSPKKKKTSLMKKTLNNTTKTLNIYMTFFPFFFKYTF